MIHVMLALDVGSETFLRLMEVLVQKWNVASPFLNVLVVELSGVEDYQKLDDELAQFCQQNRCWYILSPPMPLGAPYRGWTHRFAWQKINRISGVKP